MYKNVVKEMLFNKQPVLGCMVNGPFPALVEILGLAGFHFVFIDAEHSTLSFRECEELVRAAEIRHIVPFIRTPENNPKTILRYMDLGAMGIIIPDVNRKEEAEAAVRAVKYAPRGDRGLATTRCQDFGYGKSKSEYFKVANYETMVIALIESKEGVDNAKEILAVEGVDACFIGTSDLSMSLGVLGQVDHPLVRSAFDKVLNLGIQMGKPVGVVVRDNETPKQLLDRGLSMVFTGVNALVKGAAKDFITKAGC
jgi:4-hydroxy-2-oxoheptanedioate aldolase